MPSLLPGYEYDIFISYRQNDNRSGWVRQFVEDLREELGATLKDPVNIYFDENPHDGLQDTHLVDESLKGKLKCLIFIPILSRTYCDPKSFAWNHEFVPFCHQALNDQLGPVVRLGNGNAAGRILPVLIHDIDSRDRLLFEERTGNPLRGVEFVFRSPGVNRPLTVTDNRSDNLGKTFYRDQINKTANAIEGILRALTDTSSISTAPATSPAHEPSRIQTTAFEVLWRELVRRNVFRASLAYLIVSLLIIQALAILVPAFGLGDDMLWRSTILLAMGFPIALTLAWFFEISPDGIIRTSSTGAYDNPYPPYRKKPLTSAPLLTVLVLALLLMAAYLNIMVRPIHPQAQISLGVLTFESRSEDPEDRYLSEGLTDDIINRLIIVSQLRVTTDAKIKATENLVTAGVFEIANTMGVSTLLMGSVQRSGELITIRAKLFDVKSSSYIWGQTFNRTKENLVDVQSEIVHAIAEHLKVNLNDIEELRLNTVATGDPKAYDFYLQGRSLYLRYDPQSNDSAIAMFKSAISIDRGYARAWAGLADAYAQLHGRFGKEYFWTDSSLAASRRSVELDSNLAEGYKAIAVAYNYRKEYLKAIPELQKAVALSPTYVQAVGNLGITYFSLRDLPNAIKWELTCAGLDPSNWVPYQIIGWTHRLLGNLTESESWLKESLKKPRGKRYDTYEHLGYTLVTMGRKQDALQLIPELLRESDTDTRAYETAGLIAHFAGDTNLAASYFIKSIEMNSNYKDDLNTFSPIGLGLIKLNQGNKVEAEVYLSHAMFNLTAQLNNGSQSADLPYYVAAVHAIRGKRSEALEWLKKAIAKNWVDHAMLEHGPYFVQYREDKDFVALLSQLKAKTAELRKQVQSK